MSDTPESKADSILLKLRTEWKTAGSKDPASKDKEALLKAWKKAASDREAAEKAVESSTVAESAAVLALAKAFGARSLRIDGQVYDFASRGERVFFRRQGTDVVDL